MTTKKIEVKKWTLLEICNSAEDLILHQEDIMSDIFVQWRDFYNLQEELRITKKTAKEDEVILTEQLEEKDEEIKQLREKIKNISKSNKED